jgi:hypothetical protein
VKNITKWNMLLALAHLVEELDLLLLFKINMENFLINLVVKGRLIVCMTE